VCRCVCLTAAFEQFICVLFSKQRFIVSFKLVCLLRLMWQ